MSAFTMDELAREARRELAMRERLYPGWVEAGRMKIDDAERRIAMMEAIAEILGAETEAEQAEERLI